MQLNINKTKIIVFALLIISAMFFGLFSLAFAGFIGKKYVYLIPLPLAFVFLLLFIFDRYLLFAIILITRSSLDRALDAIKLGSFGVGAVLNAMVILIAIMLYFQHKKGKPFKFDEISTSWFIFLGLSLLSVAYAPTKLQCVKVFLQFVSYASMFYLGFALTRNAEDFAKWLKVIIYSGLIPLLFGLFSLVFGGPGQLMFLGEGLRVLSTFNHPNPFSFYLVLVITMTFYVYKAKPEFIDQRFIRLLPFYLIGLMILLLMTKTRAAWGACFMFLGLYGLFFERKLLLYMFISCFLLLLIPDVQDRLLDLQKGNDFGVTGYEKLNSWAWRKKYWHDAIAWMQESHYLFGYGLRSFMHYSTTFGVGNAFSKQDFELNAHSVYVQLFFELGIFGLLSFIILMIVHLKRLLSLYKVNKLLIFTVSVLIVEYSVENATDNIMDYLNYVWYLWFIIGMTISYVTYQKNSMNISK